MPYMEAMDSQFLKGDFRRITVLYNISDWYIMGDVPGGNYLLTGATDATSAMADALTWLSNNGYQQITYWSERSSTETHSVWFLPA